MTNCIFEPRTDTSSATICKHCGQEKILHNHNIQVSQLYTEEQVREAIDMARSQSGYASYEYKENEIIQSLKQPKQ